MPAKKRPKVAQKKKDLSSWKKGMISLKEVNQNNLKGFDLDNLFKDDEGSPVGIHAKLWCGITPNRKDMLFKSSRYMHQPSVMCKNKICIFNY